MKRRRGTPSASMMLTQARRGAAGNLDRIGAGGCSDLQEQSVQGRVIGSGVQGFTRFKTSDRVRGLLQLASGQSREW